MMLQAQSDAPTIGEEREPEKREGQKEGAWKWTQEHELQELASLTPFFTRVG